MAKEEKKVKDYTVAKKSIGSALVWKGKKVLLNNGLPQTTLKAMHAFGLKAIIKNAK
jgi:hypothetical protein